MATATTNVVMYLDFCLLYGHYAALVKQYLLCSGILVAIRSTVVSVHAAEESLPKGHKDCFVTCIICNYRAGALYIM